MSKSQGFKLISKIIVGLIIGILSYFLIFISLLLSPQISNSKVLGFELVQKVATENKMTITPSPVLLLIIPIAVFINLFIYYYSHGKTSNDSQK